MVTPRTFYGEDLFREMRRVQDEMNRLVRTTTRSGTNIAGDFPPMNIYASEDAIGLTAELPGVSDESLDITVHRDTVTIRGERQGQPQEAHAYHRRERGHGRFVRTLGLPFHVDPDKVDATLSDGVLRLTLHRPEQDKPKRIKVKPS